MRVCSPHMRWHTVLVHRKCRGRESVIILERQPAFGCSLSRAMPVMLQLLAALCCFKPALTARWRNSPACPVVTGTLPAAGGHCLCSPSWDCCSLENEILVVCQPAWNPSAQTETNFKWSQREILLTCKVAAFSYCLWRETYVEIRRRSTDG